MALEIVVDSIDGLDDSIKNLYIADGDKFKLDLASDIKTQADVDNVKTALQAERALKKSLEVKLNSFGTMTADEVKALQTQLEQAKLNVKDSDSDEVKQRIEDIKALYQNKLSASTSELETLQNQLKENQNKILDARFNDELRNQLDDKVNPKSVEDIIKLAKLELKYNNDADSFNTSDGLDSKSWLSNFLKDKAYFLKESVTGVSKGSSNKNNTENPWTTDNWTEQTRILISNPELAKKLQLQAK